MVPTALLHTQLISYRLVVFDLDKSYVLGTGESSANRLLHRERRAHKKHSVPEAAGLPVLQRCRQIRLVHVLHCRYRHGLFDLVICFEGGE